MATAYVIAGAWLEEKTVAAEMGREWETYCRNMPICMPRKTLWRP
jgi:protein-S-isoprenylcysteine O-methyltransferase Ste14